MPRRELLSPAQRAQLLALPEEAQELARHYTLSPADLALVAKHRGDHNRLGFAVQLCFFRHPSRAWSPEETLPEAMSRFIASQANVQPNQLSDYAKRDETRREHLLELQRLYGWESFDRKAYRELSGWLLQSARSTDQGIVLVKALLSELKERRILAPSLAVLEGVASGARGRARREVYRLLTEELTVEQRRQLEDLLKPQPESWQTRLGWLRSPLGAANPPNALKRIERIEFLRKIGIPTAWARRVHQNRLLQMAREGLQTTTQRKHLEAFHENGKAINEKVQQFAKVGQALIAARDASHDAYQAIESLLPWEAFCSSVAEAAKLAQPEDFDYLARISDGYSHIRRYAPAFLETFDFHATPATEELLKAVRLLRELNTQNLRRVPDDAPKGFIRRRWDRHVWGDDGLDRRFYELCVLSEVRNALRSGDLWVEGSRQFKNFEEYLLPEESFRSMRSEGLPLAVETRCEAYLAERSKTLHESLTRVNRLAERGELPDASITDGVLKVTPLTNAVPAEVDDLMRRTYAKLPRIKVTDLLVEVDSWTDLSQHFRHLRTGDVVKDRALLLTAILSDGINLGLSKMADACPGTSLSKLNWVADWHIRDETYSKALAEVVNHHHRLPFAAYWGEGTTSSSDGQRFRAGGRGEALGQVNARYGNDAGVTFYTHISDQYSPFHTKAINATVRDATHVLDGLLYHETDLRIEEHYTDTAGFTEHVFALCHLLGFRFAPRIRDLADKRLYTVEKPSTYPALEGLIGTTLSTKHIANHWEEVLRLATSIKQGTVTASLILRKLGAYPRQNGLAVALRELGRLERTLFMLEWLESVELRRRVHVGLNKGEARNALARAVFFNRLGELRDRTYENQRYRASGLNLLVAAIVRWNTVYLERAISALRAEGQTVSENHLAHLSPLG
jgi:TnpA family transposase